MNTMIAPDVRETVCDFENLYNAMNVCKKSVMWKDSVAGWTKNGIINCARLEEQLKNGTYNIDEYSRFIIYEPKKRDIVSTRFKDSVFQRSLCDNYLTEQITKSFIYDNGACLTGKGTEFARGRLVAHIQKFYRKHGRNGYVLKCDITNFFGSTPHSVVKEKMRKLCDDDWAYSEVCRIIDSFGTKDNPEVGMGLGSQATQLCQLAVLNDIDHGIKEHKRIKHYVRYMDDLILLHENKDTLKDCLQYIRDELEKMGLQLSAKKTQIFPITQAIHFLGYSFRLAETGKVVKKVLPNKFSHERHKLKRMKGLVEDGKLTRDKMDKCFESWLAHATAEPSDRRKGSPFLCRTDDYHRIENMKRFYKSLWEV
ncbi:MAG: RNA-directed DNA polymerase [Clostridia bacterium]|nr:RNA-directed DNA polymerase [Clostridia bacterium]